MTNSKNVLVSAVNEEDWVGSMPISEEEKADMKEDIAAKTMALRRLALEKKEAMEAFKKAMNPLVEDLDILADELTAGNRIVTRRVHVVPHDTQRIMELYDMETGDLLGTRPMTAEERTKYWTELDRLHASKAN